MSSKQVSLASAADLAKLKVWLEDEWKRYDDGFFCNWRMIEEACNEGRLLIIHEDGDPVAFLADSNHGPDILQVQREYRGRKFGRRLAEAARERAVDRGLSVMEIQCAPRSSVPFWIHMGFTLNPDHEERVSGVHAHRLLSKEHKLGTGSSAEYSISLFPRARDWKLDTAPHFTRTGSGTMDGTILQLSERIALFDAATHLNTDMVVRVEVGQFLYEDKLKRPSAHDVGVRRDAGYNYYIDTVDVSAAPGVWE